MRAEPTPIVYKDTITFIGYDGGQLISRVSSEEWRIAEEALKDAESGTKLRCYEYDEGPFGYNEEGQSTHTFVVIYKKVYAISPDDDSILISERKSKTSSRRTISDQEWAFAKKELEEKPCHTKLPHRVKLYKTFPHPETGAPVTLKHSFIKMGDEIYAMAGQGHEIHGLSAKIKILVNKEGEFFALKLLHKRFAEIFNSAVWLGFFKKEITISTEVGFVLASATKTTGQFQQQLIALLP